jgi:UPF0755 protein
MTTGQDTPPPTPDADPPRRGWFARREKPIVLESDPPPSSRAARKLKRSAAARKPWVEAWSFAFTAAFILAGVAFYVVAGVRSQFTQPGPLQADRVVVVPPSGIGGIAERLRSSGVIDASGPLGTLGFTIGAHLFGLADELKAGEYQFPRGASMKDVAEILRSGRVVQHAITIPEGLTSRQVVERLRANQVLSGTIENEPAEGTLLPDTYRVPRGYPRQQIINAMARAHQRFVEEAFARRTPDLPVRSAAELITLASIVERETSRADERTRVAGVFVNRLNRRMRLQSDPTIIYGIVGGQGPLGRAITRADIDRPTPFNTYTIPGLPPGPIGNPGRETILATANPMRHNELFFVADGTGGHTFSETYDQHQRAVARWREIERSRGGSVSPGTEIAPAGAAATTTRPAPAQQQRPGQRANLPQQPTPQAAPNTGIGTGTAEQPRVIQPVVR